MTDIERFVDLYKSFGIDCTVKHEVDGSAYISFTTSHHWIDHGSTRIDGPEGLDYHVTFDAAGKFSSHELESNSLSY